MGAALALEMTGLDYLRSIAEGRIPAPPIAALLGLGIVGVEPGRVTFSLDVGEHLYNPIGSVHGGVFCTLLDSAMACAVHSRLGPGQAYTTLELKVNLVKPLTGHAARGGHRAGDQLWPTGRYRLGPDHRARRDPLRARHHDLSRHRDPAGGARERARPGWERRWALIPARSWPRRAWTLLSWMRSAPSLRTVTSGRVNVEAAALSQGRTQQLWRVDITDESGRLVAHGEVRLQNVAGRY